MRFWNVKSKRKECVEDENEVTAAFCSIGDVNCASGDDVADPDYERLSSTSSSNEKEKKIVIGLDDHHQEVEVTEMATESSMSHNADATNAGLGQDENARKGDTAEEEECSSSASNGKSSSQPSTAASPREVFSFARTRKTKMFICLAFAASIVSGATMPGEFLTLS